MSWRVRVQADDFLNAYKILSENNQSVIDKLAVSAGKPLVSKTVLGTIPAMGVDVVCLAFSVELYIKDIYCVLNIELPRGKDGHDILKLFEKLPEPIRQRIFVHDSISQNPFMTRGDLFSPQIFSRDYSSYDRFRDQLKAISDAFVKWRYAYEHTTLSYDISFALSFIEAAKSTADSIRVQSKCGGI